MLPTGFSSIKFGQSAFTDFDPTARLTIEDVVKMINQDSAADSAASALNIHLKASQGNFEL